jgi:hypothetical protein
MSRRLVVGVLAVSVLVGSVPDGLGADAAYDPQVIVRYKGTFTSFAYTASKVDQGGKVEFVSPKTQSWKWAYEWVGKLSALQRRPFKFTRESIRGVVRRMDQLPGGRTGNCVFTYGSKPGAYPLNAPVQVTFSSGKGYDWNKGTITFIQFPPVSPNYVLALSESDPKNNGHCRTIGPSPDMAAKFPPSMGKVFRFTDLGHASVRTRRFDRTHYLPDNPSDVRETLSSSITLDIGASR